MAGRKYIYFFGCGTAEGSAEHKDLLGGKGAGLAEMDHMGIPVPPGFTISTEACELYYKIGAERLFERLLPELTEHLQRLENVSGKTFGKGANPLLVSVRSGGAISMPGMMDTVLNLGLNDAVLEVLIERSGSRRFAYDAYRRFIQMFGDVVLGITATDDHGLTFNPMFQAMDQVKLRYGRQADTELTADEMAAVTDACKTCYQRYAKESFPEDPMEQLKRGISAVFRSWNSPRAIRYREINAITGLRGTAVNVQAMVFGNMGDDSGTGVAFTRDPAIGENCFYGEFLMNAQGEDVVAGIRTPQPIQGLKDYLPEAYNQLEKIRHQLEQHFRDMQDFEFTIEQGHLYVLQTRRGQRTGPAAVRMAIEMMDEGLLTESQALCRVPANDLDQMLHPQFDPTQESKARILAEGLPASPGAAFGHVVFTAEHAEHWHKRGKRVILCRTETSADDVGGMHLATGILTSRGGMTSHAAVVARGWGKCCVVGAEGVLVDYAKRQFTAQGQTVREGDWISINGHTGRVYCGHIATTEPQLTGSFARLMTLADKYRKLGVRANSDTPEDTRVAVTFGAEGIGLTRTEHMFFKDDRIKGFRRLILVSERVKAIEERLADAAGSPERIEQIQIANESVLKQYHQALDALLPLQRQDFEGIFRVLDGRPCTIRLLDPPLHEFLPSDEESLRDVAREMDMTDAELNSTMESLRELNPMMGHRGCRLGLSYPQVTEMQVRAIIEAAIHVRHEGLVVQPEIMVPLVGKVEELQITRRRIEAVLHAVCAQYGLNVNELGCQIGTMIEVPRAAITADQIATFADFFSFGTNDLTQLCCGFSRDDAGKYLGDYVRMGIYKKDPFKVLDQDGVGKMVQMAIELGRSVRNDLKAGICGEHAGESESIKFCHHVGLDYVSCSPYRVPIARLAAAQAAIEAG